MLWNVQNYVLGTTESLKHVVYSREVDDGSDSAVRAGVAASIDKALDLLELNICDDSRYFLFEWDVKDSELTIVITDGTKKIDAEHMVKCRMLGLDLSINQGNGSTSGETNEQLSDISDSVADWAYDYLTTCDRFLGCSLVALFHCDTRQSTRPL